MRDGTNWSQQAYVKASNTGAGDSFGVVAVSGDTVVVGAPSEDSHAAGVNGNQSDNSAAASGAAYIFAGFGSPAQLAIDQSGGKVRIFWPVTATGFVLDETSTLASTPAATMWSQVPFPYETNSTHISLTLTMPSGNKFYRLRKP